MSLWQWVKNTRQSELVVVLGEDLAALFGLTFALIAVVLAMITGNPVWDTAGSIGIGALLIFVSFFLAIKVKGLLVGQSADKETRDNILQFLQNRPEIEEVLNVITLQMGETIMVSIKARMKQVDTAENLVKNINACEVALKSSNKAIQWVFFEPDVIK